MAPHAAMVEWARRGMGLVVRWLYVTDGGGTTP